MVRFVDQVATITQNRRLRALKEELARVGGGAMMMAPESAANGPPIFKRLSSQRLILNV